MTLRVTLGATRRFGNAKLLQSVATTQIYAAPEMSKAAGAVAAISFLPKAEPVEEIAA